MGEGCQAQRGGISQFRRANIVYFLSRDGSVEHPHLLRVHHLQNNGVHLHDVKRWIGELRGKDMPDSFSWSYKRRYKSGYVWQDLKDEDLITPISDNEYVVKGSALRFQPLDAFPYDEAALKEEAVPEQKPGPETLRFGREGEAPPPPQPDGDSPAAMDGTGQRMAVLKMDGSMRRQEGERRQEEGFKRSYSSRASHVFRNILGCRSADAKEPVMLPAGRGGPNRRRSTSDAPPQRTRRQQGPEGDRGSRKSRRSDGGKSGGSAGYRPLGAPNCSQCGRQFDPEKFQAHMQSCRALRGRGRGRIGVDKGRPLRREPSQGEDDFSRESISGYLA